MLAGGFSTITDSNDTELNTAQETATNALHSRLGLPVTTTLLHAERQVVAGLNYRLILEVHDAKLDTSYYKAQILHHLPHEGGAYQVTSLDQLDTNEARHTYKDLVSQPQDTNHPAVQDAASYAVQVLTERSNSLSPYQLKTVESAFKVKQGDADVYDMALKVTRGEEGTSSGFRVKVEMHTKGATLVSSHPI